MDRRFSPRVVSLGKFVAWAAFGVCALLVVVRAVDPINYANSDFFTFWLGGRLALEGQNLYAADVWIGGHHRYGATWIPNDTFISPQPLALLFKQQWKALLAEGLTGLALAGLGWWQNPAWVSGLLSAGQAKLAQTFGFSPTVWGISAFLCDFRLTCTVGIGAGMAVLLLGFGLFWMYRNRAWLSGALAAGLAICLTLLTTPYTWTYDQLLLSIPIVFLVLGLGERGAQFLPTALLFLLIDILAFALLALTAALQKEGWNALVAFSVLGLLLWLAPKLSFHQKERRNETPALV